MRFGHTSLRCTGIPALSCALLVLTPLPAAVASAPGARALPRAVSSPLPYAGVPDADGPAASRAHRLPARLADALAGYHEHGPHGVPLPLPPLFGHHEHEHGRGHEHGRDGDRTTGRHDRDDAGAESDRTGTEGEHAGARDRSAREPAAGAAPRTDARDASGGDSSPAPATPTPSANPLEQAPVGSVGEAPQPWSPAPVAPHDAERTAAGGAEPASREALPGGRTGGEAPEGRAAPAAAQAPAGPIVPVLPLGAGLASLGLGLAFLALRLRRG